MHPLPLTLFYHATLYFGIHKCSRVKPEGIVGFESVSGVFSPKSQTEMIEEKKKTSRAI